ncbi:hypothetical protein CAFE_25000 [Caprobacter fermentans]|uniref:Uncharacterized protein n=1 Tax=Caproicibacter fermentans TaxID=2576756 RepID=A0A6N8I1M9_9FIRM|nr:hypothetical protein [Caproicibacter fermentans]MVB11775.1 hypothetical protein [Caproicibacter fermentans]
MKKLTMSRARQLIERELGIKAKELTAPESMNGNPEFPWYELHLGNQTVTVSTSGYGGYSKGYELINLSVTHENSLFYVSEYFYSDTMEYCDEYTQKVKYDVLCEKMDIPDTDPKYKRLAADASDAVFRHYHQPKQRVEQKNEADQPSGIFKIRFFGPGGVYFNDTKPFDAPSLAEFIRIAKEKVLKEHVTTPWGHQSEIKMAGFSVFEWHSKSEYWVIYAPNRKEMTYDTGLRWDGRFHEEYERDIFTDKCSGIDDLKDRLEKANVKTPEKSTSGSGKHRSGLML